MVLGEQAIHAISAPDHAPARAIHVYLGDINNVERSILDPDTLDEHPMTRRALRRILPTGIARTRQVSVRSVTRAE